VTDASESPQAAPNLRADDAARSGGSWRVGDPRRVASWGAELACVPLGLLQTYGPSRAFSARTREQLILAVTEANGVRSAAWVHGAWLDFLGTRDPDDALAPLFDYARACAEAGGPLDTTALAAVYPRSVVRTLRATVAVAELNSAVGASADDVWARLSGRGRGSVADAVGQAVGFGLALPWLAPSVAVAGTMKVLTRLAPPLPRIELPPAPEANLVVHLLAEAAPAYLGHVLVRTGVVLSPVPVAVAFRMDGTSATIRLGRGRVAISNGVQPDAIAVVDGGVEPLLQIVAGSILKDLGVPVRRRH
jgi:hypothetical protein